MAINLTALSDATLIANTLANLILVRPQEQLGYRPQDLDGNIIGSPLLFHTEGRNVAELTSDVTDHYVEDNIVLNDQIALRPETVFINGFIGELNDVSPYFAEAIKFAEEKLYIISGLSPELTTTALIALNATKQVFSLAAKVNNGISKWTSVNKPSLNVIGSEGLADQTPDPVTQNKQQVAFQQFYGYWRERTLFTVQTPWAIFKNMTIKNLTATQDSETNVITDFQIEFKMIRFAKVIVESTLINIYDPVDFQGRLLDQGSSIKNMGTQKSAAGIPLSGFLA